MLLSLSQNLASTEADGGYADCCVLAAAAEYCVLAFRWAYQAVRRSRRYRCQLVAVCNVSGL